VQAISLDLSSIDLSPEVTGGLFGVGGVALCFALNALASSRTRKQMTAEQRERERRERELVVAEHLDEALVRASAALDRDTSIPVEERYQQAYDHWQEAWVSYSSRLRQPELLRRYRVVALC